MARRRSSKSKSGMFSKLIVAMLLVVTGAAGGYAWRSYAPLPLPTPLGGDNAFAQVKPLGTSTSTPAPPSTAARPTASSVTESSEIARLRAELDRLRAAQSETAQDLAEIQIKSVLGED